VNGADVNKSDNSGWTPLCSAADRGYLEIVKLLIENGGDINKSNNDGFTPLYSAAYKGHLEIVRLLIKNDADINQPSFRGDTAMDVTTNQQIKQLFQVLKQPWTANTHQYFPLKTQKQISTLMKLTFRNCQIGRLPKEILLYICQYVAFSGMISEIPQTDKKKTAKKKPAKKKQKKKL
jgi:ankyrin repeat protein